MASRVAVYRALETKCRSLALGEVCVMNAIERFDLRKLTKSDLESCDFAPQYAKEVSEDLLNERFESLEQFLGHKLEFSHAVPPLVLDSE